MCHHPGSSFPHRVNSAKIRRVRERYLKDAGLVVVKFGTGILTDESKHPDPARLKQLVVQVAAQVKAGREVVLVTSGAVGAGMGALGFDQRPIGLADLQACAAIGQSKLMAIYQQLFADLGLTAAQVLLTHEDLSDRDRHLNARNSLLNLLEHGVIPIVNENDAVSCTELRFGDNDRLSAMVASLIHADLHVILTTADGVIENFGQADARLVPLVEKIDERIEQMASGTASVTAVGGMTTKIEAARIATRSGIGSIIANGHDETILAQVLTSKDVGTFFVPQEGKLKGRKRWIAFFHHPKGYIHVDAGAKVALRDRGRSLLQVGVVECVGNFAREEVVRICDEDGTEFARGITQFAADEITPKTGREDEVVHRDDLVIL
ncbi:MAG: glutamate 5-kinase [Limisphaerales bacterium]|jgi:glutamate 5-kinase